MKILAPLSGLILPIEQVPDPVFAQKMVGDGLAIDPTDNVLRAPCDGEVVQLHPAKHAVTIAVSGGEQVLMHIGLDTVNLKGDGFTPKVKVGERVKAGAPLIEFHADKIAQKAKSLITLIVIPGESQIKNRASGSVRAGQKFFELSSAAQKNKSASPGKTAESAAVKVNLPTGMHARPAAIVVGMAKNYKSDIEVVKGSLTANAKSVVSLLSLEIGYGDHLRFRAVGEDSEQAVSEMAELMQDLREQPMAVTAEAKTTVRASTDPNVIAAVGISPGLAIGRVFQIRGETFAVEEKSKLGAAQEKARLNTALGTAGRELQDLMLQVKEKTDASQAAIFAAHLELLTDPDILQAAGTMIDQGKSAAFAWQKTTDEHANRLSKLNNELLANRANDLRDVARRVLRQLAPGQKAEARRMTENSILIAENLTPSDTVALDRDKVVAFCTTTGGATSHVAILARSLGLPALAGAEAKVLQIPDGTEIILDGEKGELRLNPTEEQKRAARKQQDEQHELRQAALSLAHQPALTRDGVRIEVAANIGNLEDAKQAVELGADGVGLLRSEFLFLERDHAPSEDEQYEVYQDIADALGDRPLVIRTLDVGGDKPLRYLPMPPEENPFLGVRGIRIGLVRPEILRTQLRAILRVKSKAKIHIMFPMISTLEELQQAKAILESERQALGAPEVAVGIMVEVPSAALIADVLAPEVDFFSIGTNDLTQYTLAMDRGHKDLAKQVDALHPSVLKLIEMTAAAGAKHGKWVGVCGGLASDLNAVAILLGLGVTELSVSLPSIPLVKSRVRESAMPQAQELAKSVLGLKNGAEVREQEKKVHNLNNNPWQGKKNVDSESLVFEPSKDR